MGQLHERYKNIKAVTIKMDQQAWLKFKEPSYWIILYM